MEAADVDGDGTLDYGEFVAVSIHLKKIGNDEHLHKAFACFDQNNSGYIEIEELKNALADDLGPNHEEVINAIIHDVDTDKDGRISYEEFATMMKAGTDWRKASRQYSRERFNSLSLKLMKDGTFIANIALQNTLFSPRLHLLRGTGGNRLLRPGFTGSGRQHGVDGGGTGRRRRPGTAGGMGTAGGGAAAQWEGARRFRRFSDWKEAEDDGGGTGASQVGGLLLRRAAAAKGGGGLRLGFGVSPNGRRQRLFSGENRSRVVGGGEERGPVVGGGEGRRPVGGSGFESGFLGVSGG